MGKFSPYRCCFFDEEGRLLSHTLIKAADGESARQQCQTMFYGPYEHAAEIWCGSRLVARCRR
jgi:hypothetical protein